MDFRSEPPLAPLLDDPLTHIPDLPQHPALRIAPLRDPVPSRTFSVPSPLEPNAGADREAHATKAKLSNRKLAQKPEPKLAENVRTATNELPISSQLVPKLSENYLPSFINLRVVENKPYISYGGDESRKRRRLLDQDVIGEYVQLPKPHAQKEQKKLPPLGLPTILNGLHEPPPNAALLPRIEANEISISDVLAKVTMDRGLPSAELTEPQAEQPEQPEKPAEGADPPTTAKGRKARKPGQKWTEQETNDLLQGVAKFGVGHWKEIVSHSEYTFNGRNSVDLKDRFRICCPDTYGKRPPKKKKSTNQPQSSSSDAVATPATATTLHPAFSKISSQPTEAPSPSKSGPKPGPRPNRQHRKAADELARLGITKPFKNSAHRSKRAFTGEEDADLVKGHEIHGFQWTKIMEDASLNLGDRRATDLRDRFKFKFPEVYALAGASADDVGAKMPPAEEVSTKEIGGIVVGDTGQELPGLSTVVGDSGQGLPGLSTAVPYPSLLDDGGVAFDWGDNTLPPLTWTDLGDVLGL